MDPDEALRLLEEAIGAMDLYRDGVFPRPDLDRAMEQASEAFTGLNAWLTRGGFLPAAWDHGREPRDSVPTTDPNS